MTLSLSPQTFSDMQNTAEAQAVKDLVAWAEKQIAFALDTTDSALLQTRIEATLRFGKRHGLDTPREWGLLFAVFAQHGPHLSAEARFVAALRGTDTSSRLSLLYDLLTSSLPVDMISKTPPNWQVLLNAETSP